tara:strand:- start:787 stop:2067 length:1281 start_codon:yes stop_codon:yes gene_type:complete
MIYNTYNFSFTKSYSGKIKKPNNLNELKILLKKKFVIVGNQRSYNDCFIGYKQKISLTNFNKIINFDKKKKLIEVETGISLKELNNFLLKNGFMLECMPGCKYVTIGGMIANNISGKLNIKNNLSNYIHSLKVIDKNLDLLNCSLRQNKKLFKLTINGKGATGPIISAKIKITKITSDNVKETILSFKSYNHFYDHLKKISKFKYVVCWVDFTKKNFDGLFFLGNHNIHKNKFKFKINDIYIPIIFAKIIGIFINNIFFISLFNRLFKFKNLIFKKKNTNFNDFFFPQNKIKNWNYFFSQGFVQFQIYLKIKDLKKIIRDIKFLIKENQLITNFVIIKFHKKILKEKNFKISLSIDFPIKRNFSRIKKALNNFVIKNNTEVELSKDIILDKLNKKTLDINPVFKKKNLKYFHKNYESSIFKRLEKI